ncbi:hypothetical protein [Rhodococcus wratislaviensis]|uniref:Uncharacterized protein n=1 Tax=Rhodococcus wratislaviensis NBRC 100605 TaxID=1219028 RepID=X0RB58_RHOWR|nr:hypothetical protein [Rhodococcus wratislaviensis]GAF48255.1 hypothetical protein RW1_051_00190 [Rhodococcus wratislaviensis NBRC 100605]
MSRTSVVANRRLYTINDLEPRAAGDVFQAIVIAQLVDGLTGTAVRGPIRVHTDVDGFRAGASADGYAGLLGTPSRVFPFLATLPYEVVLTLFANGYAPRRERVPFPVQASFPLGFIAADLGQLTLHRAPVALTISTYEFDPSNRPVPLPGAAVRISGSWASVDRLGQPAATVRLLAATTGLTAPRPTGATVDLPVLTTPAEPARVLQASAPIGATVLAVSNTGTLTAGDLVGLDLTSPHLTETIEVVSVTGPSDPHSPAVLGLRHPLCHPHRRDAPAQRIPAPGAAPPLVTLIRKALAGDQTLVVNTLVGMTAGRTMRISGGPAAPEFRMTDLYQLTTDSDGFGRFPPLTGLAAVKVSAKSGPRTASALVTLTQPSPVPGLDLTLR